MKTNVSQLLKSPIGSVRSLVINKTIDIAGGSHLVQGELELLRTGRSILVKGTLQTTTEANCSRCLGLFSCPLRLDLEEEYFPTTDVVSGASLPLPEESGGFIIDERFILDLTEAVYQYMVLAMPMKPLCREECAGLCPYCGHDLNQGPCDCMPEIESRWYHLLKPVSNEGKG